MNPEDEVTDADVAEVLADAEGINALWAYRFAKEVKRLREALPAAVAAETERCARVAAASGDVYNIGTCIAAAIRAGS